MAAEAIQPCRTDSAEALQLTSTARPRWPNETIRLAALRAAAAAVMRSRPPNSWSWHEACPIAAVRQCKPSAGGGTAAADGPEAVCYAQHIWAKRLRSC